MSSILTTTTIKINVSLKKYIIMTYRMMLKNLWLNQKLNEELKVDKKTITIDEYGNVIFTTQTNGDWHQYTTHQGKNATEYVLNSEEYKSGEYELIVNNNIWNKKYFVYYMY